MHAKPHTFYTLTVRVFARDEVGTRRLTATIFPLLQSPKCNEEISGKPYHPAAQDRLPTEAKQVKYYKFYFKCLI